MSKLKRRKTAVEEIRSEQQFRSNEQNESLRISDASLRSRAEGSPALCEVEKLWLETLQVLCPQSSSQDVPPLPHLSTKVDTHSEQRWCSLDEEVLPLPDLHSHYPPPPSISSPMSTPLPQVLSGCPSHHSTMCELDVNRVTAEGEAEDEREGEDEGEDEGEGKAQSRTSNTSKLNSRTALRSGIRSGSDTEAGDEAGLGSDRVRLEHCPMCLMAFPAGFSQLECDGHLAQCLSEMNVDVVW